MILENYLTDIQKSNIDEFDSKLLEAISIEYKEILTEEEQFIFESIIDDALAKFGTTATAQKIADFIYQHFKSEPDRYLRQARDVAFSGALDTYSKALTLSNKTGLSKYAKRGEEYVDKAAKAINTDTGKVAAQGIASGLAVAAIVAALVYGSYKTYKRFLSPEAKKCGNLSGEAKTLCMVKARDSAMRQQISDLKSASKLCNISKDPNKCKKKIAEKIHSIESKMKTRG